jgi:hypothetical protein
VNFITGRRGVLTALAWTAATSAVGLASARAKPAKVATEPAEPGATRLDALKKRLVQAPRRRDFKTVPMILNHQEQWDYEALTATQRKSGLPAVDRDRAWTVEPVWLTGSISRQALIIHASVGAYGHPISTTHPGPGTMVSRKPCNLTTEATRFRPSPNPNVRPALSDR